MSHIVIWRTFGIANLYPDLIDEGNYYVVGVIAGAIFGAAAGC